MSEYNDAGERITPFKLPADSDIPRSSANANLMDTSPLPEGTLILGGRYRLLQVLHQRPRINLYLAQRLPSPHSGSSATGPKSGQEQLVAIRELILADLTPSIRKQIEQAAFEEFVSPAMLGSPRLPGAGDRVRPEGDRHYLVMQLRGSSSERRAIAVTLADLLLQKQWPSWLSIEVALEWGIQLCRIVARLHRLGVVLGDLEPDTILVDREWAAAWAPVLLVSWPPAPYFWTLTSDGVAVPDRYAELFPSAPLASLYDQPFAAPEMLAGQCDELADIYSLGALLYLLTTRYAPVAALRRLRMELEMIQPAIPGASLLPLPLTDGVELIPPTSLNPDMPPAVARIILRAMELNPQKRYLNIFALIEALEVVSGSLTSKNREGTKVARRR